MPTGGSLLNGTLTPFEYVIDLADGISLDPGTDYWISVMNDPGPDHFWRWARADGILDNQTAATFDDVSTGPWNVFVNGGMFFELNNENIPEPTSLQILSIFALTTLLIRKRRSYPESV